MATSKYVKMYREMPFLPIAAKDAYEMAHQWYGDEHPVMASKAVRRMDDEGWEFIGYGEFGELYVPPGFQPSEDDLNYARLSRIPIPE